MSKSREIPRIPSTAIAFLALLLGVMFAFRIMRGSAPGSDWAARLSQVRVTGFEILVIAILVVGLIFLKTIADFRHQTEQSLLQAFLENIPDNVFFKDRESRFIRISNAMAAYFGLADPSQATNKSDADMFSAEHAKRAFADEDCPIATSFRTGFRRQSPWPHGTRSGSP